MKSKEKYVYKIKRDYSKTIDDFTISTFSCYDFLESTRTFIERNFEGAIELSYPERAFGSISISPKGFAFFIRLVMFEWHDDKLIRIKIEYSENKITVTVEKPGGIKIEDRLLNIARNSGFSASAEDGIITLTVSVWESAEIKLYAKDRLYFLFYYYEAFML